MEIIKFRVIQNENNDMCRIEAKDIRNTYTKIADGGCICTIDVMISEMEHITNEVRRLGNEAVFVMD